MDHFWQFSMHDRHLFGVCMALAMCWQVGPQAESLLLFLTGLYNLTETWLHFAFLTCHSQRLTYNDCQNYLFAVRLVSEPVKR